MDRCKHGMINGTCAMCAGLIKTDGELQLLWLNFIDDIFDLTFDNIKGHEVPDKDVWLKQRQYSLKQKFYKKYGQYPPI